MQVVRQVCWFAGGTVVAARVQESVVEAGDKVGIVSKRRVRNHLIDETETDPIGEVGSLLETRAVVADGLPDTGVGVRGDWPGAFVDKGHLEDVVAVVGIVDDAAWGVARSCRMVGLLKVVD